MIRVLICDDQTIVSEGLRVILSTDPEIEVIGIANDGAEAVAKVTQLKPDVVLMDLKMPVMNGIQATRLIHEQQPDTPTTPTSGSLTPFAAARPAICLRTRPATACWRRLRAQPPAKPTLTRP